MKKLAVILSFILCVSVFFCVPVSATGEEVRLYVKARGTEVTVKLKTNDSVGALQGAIKYEESDFEYDTAAASDAISANNATAVSFQDVSGATKFVLVGDSSTGNTGDWATVTYSADEGTPAEFTLGGVKVFDTAGTRLYDAAAKVIMPGDVNEDYLVNVKDYVRLKLILRSLANNPTVVENKDVNMDGSFIALSDYQQLRNDIIEN